jgi:predicted RNase H-like HicB family nuclease
MKRKRTGIGPFTAVIQKRGRRYIAFVEEIPGVNTQGRTLVEARRNLKEALRMVLQANRELTARTLREVKGPSSSQTVRELVTV